MQNENNFEDRLLASKGARVIDASEFENVSGAEGKCYCNITSGEDWVCGCEISF